MIPFAIKAKTTGVRAAKVRQERGEGFASAVRNAIFMHGNQIIAWQREGVIPLSRIHSTNELSIGAAIEQIGNHAIQFGSRLFAVPGSQKYVHAVGGEIKQHRVEPGMNVHQFPAPADHDITRTSHRYVRRNVKALQEAEIVFPADSTGQK